MGETIFEEGGGEVILNYFLTGTHNLDFLYTYDISKVYIYQ